MPSLYCGYNGATRIECYVKPNARDHGQFSAYSDAELKQAAELTGIGTGATVERLNLDDWAIVAGINYYPGLTDLQGPRLDSTLFEHWLKTSGFVPDSQVICVPSSANRPRSIHEAEPKEASILDAFQKLIRLADQRKFHHLGRRLYIFFAGHGIVATRAASPDYREAALLVADADPLFLGKHIGARTWAEWFRARGIFDEVLLFADCCRDLEDQVLPAQMVVPTWEPERQAGQYFYAFPTPLGAQEWELPLGRPARVRGILSFVVTEALRNRELYSDGLLTANSLANNIYATVPTYAKVGD